MVSMRLLYLPFLALALFQEAPPSIVSCANDGVRGKKGEVHSCACLMACVPEDSHGYGDGDKSKCATYCRQQHCHCRQPCA